MYSTVYNSVEVINMPDTILDNKVREVREMRGMSISELARRVKISRASIYAIEKKERKNISGKIMFDISEALDKDVKDIFFIVNVNKKVHKCKENNIQKDSEDNE